VVLASCTRINVQRRACLLVAIMGKNVSVRPSFPIYEYKVDGFIVILHELLTKLFQNTTNKNNKLQNHWTDFDET